MLPDPSVKCPATAFKRTCHSIVTEPGCKCPKFISVNGTNPQTNEPIQQWGCSDTFLPLLLVEVAAQSRQAGAAVESFRNETARQNQEAREAFMSALHGAAPRALPQSS